jgi:hypothetical protein
LLISGIGSLLGKTAPARDDNVGQDTNLQLIEYLGSSLAIPYAKEAISSTHMYSDLKLHFGFSVIFAQPK